MRFIGNNASTATLLHLPSVRTITQSPRAPTSEQSIEHATSGIAETYVVALMATENTGMN